jgi:hypothetical protein
MTLRLCHASPPPNFPLAISDSADPTKIPTSNTPSRNPILEEDISFLPIPQLKSKSTQYNSYRQKFSQRTSVKYSLLFQASNKKLLTNSCRARIIGRLKSKGRLISLCRGAERAEEPNVRLPGWASGQRPQHIKGRILARGEVGSALDPSPTANSAGVKRGTGQRTKRM